MRAVAPDTAHPEVETMSAVVGQLLWAPRVCAVLLALFGAVALILVMIGIYAVVAQSIAQRQREIGVRMALGAQRGDVVRLFLRQGIDAVAVGLAGGLLAALLAVSAVSDLLFGVDPRDPDVFVATARCCSRPWRLLPATSPPAGRQRSPSPSCGGNSRGRRAAG